MQTPEMITRGMDRASAECEQIRTILDVTSADHVARGQFWAGYITFIAGFASADIGGDVVVALLDAIKPEVAGLKKQHLSVVVK